MQYAGASEGVCVGEAAVSVTGGMSGEGAVSALWNEAARGKGQGTGKCFGKAHNNPWITRWVDLIKEHRIGSQG